MADTPRYATKTLWERNANNGLAFHQSADAAETSIGEDLDAGALGGKVTWAAPVLTARVTWYIIYLAESAAGAGKTKIGQDIAAGKWQLGGTLTDFFKSLLEKK